MTDFLLEYSWQIVVSVLLTYNCYLLGKHGVYIKEIWNCINLVGKALHKLDSDVRELKKINQDDL